MRQSQSLTRRNKDRENTCSHVVNSTYQLCQFATPPLLHCVLISHLAKKKRLLRRVLGAARKCIALLLYTIYPGISFIFGIITDVKYDRC